MQIKTGIDVLDKKRFLTSCKNGGETFLAKIFTPYEIKNNSKEQLASIFSVKEALVKALELSHSSWLSISTSRQENGKIACSFIDKKIAKDIISLDTSISHEGEMVIAVAVVIIENK